MKTEKTTCPPEAKAKKVKAGDEPQTAPQNVPTAQPTCCCQKVKNFFHKLFGKQLCCLLFVLFGLLGYSSQAWASVC